MVSQNHPGFWRGRKKQLLITHVLEHVRQQDVIGTLNGIRGVLKPKGQFLVSVPDWDIICHLFINPLASLDMKWHDLRMILGGQVDDNDYHYMGFNQEILFDFLKKSRIFKSC